VRARSLLDELPEDVLPHGADDAGAPARGTRAGRRAGLRPGGAAALARECDVERNADRRTRERLLEIELDDALHVAARTTCVRSASQEVLAEERGKDVGQAAEVGEDRLESSALQAGRAEPVVRRAALRIRQHLVCLGDVAEAMLGVRLLGYVRVQLTCE